MCSRYIIEIQVDSKHGYTVQQLLHIPVTSGHSIQFSTDTLGIQSSWTHRKTYKTFSLK